MPLIKRFIWSMIHKWNSDNWNEKGYWTDEKMRDELRNLKENLPTITGGKKMTLVRAIQIIKKAECISVQIGERIGRIEQVTDFSRFANVLRTWKHLRTACQHYVKVWVAQDESYTECEFKRKCHHGNPNCPDFKPMIKVTPIEELAKGMPFVFR